MLSLSNLHFCSSLSCWMRAREHEFSEPYESLRWVMKHKQNPIQSNSDPSSKWFWKLSFWPYQFSLSYIVGLLLSPSNNNNNIIRASLWPPKTCALVQQLSQRVYQWGQPCRCRCCCRCYCWWLWLWWAPAKFRADSR